MTLMPRSLIRHVSTVWRGHASLWKAALELGAGLQERASGGHRGPVLVGIGGASGGIGGHRPDFSLSA